MGGSNHGTNYCIAVHENVLNLAAVNFVQLPNSRGSVRVVTVSQLLEGLQSEGRIKFVLALKNFHSQIGVVHRACEPQSEEHSSRHGK